MSKVRPSSSRCAMSTHVHRRHSFARLRQRAAEVIEAMEKEGSVKKNSRTTLEEEMVKPSFVRAYDQEGLILEATCTLYECMESSGLSKSKVAKRLGKTKAFVTQVLDGSRNMTLRTLADFARVTGYTLRITAVKKGEERR